MTTATDILTRDTLKRHHQKWCNMMPPKPVTPTQTLAAIQYEAGRQEALRIIGEQICKI